MAELVELIEGEPASPQGSKLQSDLDVLDRRTIQLPPESPSNLQPILAVVLQGAVIAFLIISLCVDIYIRRPGSLSTADHLLYVTGITILATLITGHATGQIRRLWVYNLTSKVRGTHGLVSQARKRITLLVGLGMFLDSFKYWRISVSFLIVGLVTTSIVAGLTPTTVPVKEQVLASQYLNHYFGLFGPCLIKEPNGTDNVNSLFSWKLSDGSTLSVNTTADPWCEIPRVLPTLSDSTVYTPFGFGYKYIMGSVPVHKTALGAPYSTVFGSFGYSFGTWGLQQGTSSDFQWAAQCFPSIFQNPVQCQKAGNVTINSNEITVNTTTCDITSSVYTVNPQSEGASATGVCTAGNDVGTATIVFGSVNEHAQLLATTMYDTEFDRSQQTYSVVCTVDIAASVSFKLLNYTRATSLTNIPENVPFGAIYDTFAVNFVVLAGSPRTCVPTWNLSEVLTDVALATGAAASMKLLLEGENLDGWWPTLYYATQALATATGEGSSSFAFNNSRNPLEDALGLASAIALGMFWGSGPSNETLDQWGVAVVNGIRVGPKQWWAIIYIIPSLFSIVILIVLLIQPS